MAFLPENLLEPLSEDSPCGEPASELKTYEKLRDARRPNEGALEAFMAPRPDGTTRVMTRDIWAPREPNRVIETIVDMLATRSKDLELGVWLAETLLWRHGLAGFNEGLVLVHGLIERYWDKLHPLPDDDGDLYMRHRHLEWVGMTQSVKDSSPPLAVGFIPVTSSGISLNQSVDSRAVPTEADANRSTPVYKKREEELESGKLSPEDFGSAFDATPKQFYKDLKAGVVACRATVEALDELCRERFAATDPPGFTKLKGSLERAEGEISILLRRKLEADPDPVAAAPLAGEGETEPGPDGQPVPRRITAVSAPGFDEMLAPFGEVAGLEPGAADEAFARVAVAARYLRRSNPMHPMPYLLVRGLRWGELYSAGAELPVDLLAAPATEIRTSLKQLAASGAWPEVLELCESAMATECGRAWLDLQRYAVKACEELGYEATGRAIRRAVKHLLEDYPALASATLLDDTGSANPETVTWLAALAQAGE